MTRQVWQKWVNTLIHYVVYAITPIPNSLPLVGVWSSTMSFQNQELPPQNLMAFYKWVLKVRSIFQVKNVDYRR